MSAHEPRDDTPPPIVTRAPPPAPRRLSRKALVTLAGVSALGVAAALSYSLTASRDTGAAPEAVSVERRNTDALADAPKDYGDLARIAAADIGPPKPVSEPITQPNPAPPPAHATTDSQAGAERHRRRQQRESARTSKLFAGAGEGARAAPANTEGPGNSAIAPAQPEVPNIGDSQDRKSRFVSGGAREPTANIDRLSAPAGRHLLLAGSTIAAALITGLSSDLPGQVVAQVTEDVFDSVTGQVRLIPQGTRLLGSYDARVSHGQSRALVVWTRMIFPDGRSIDLDRMIGTDPAGQSGFADRVDNHTGRLLKAGLLSTLFGLGMHLATAGRGDNDDIAFAIRESAGRSAESAGDKLIGREMDIQPTITIRPGARVRVLVSRDLDLTP